MGCFVGCNWLINGLFLLKIFLSELTFLFYTVPMMGLNCWDYTWHHVSFFRKYLVDKCHQFPYCSNSSQKCSKVLKSAVRMITSILQIKILTLMSLTSFLIWEQDWFGTMGPSSEIRDVA